MVSASVFSLRIVCVLVVVLPAIAAVLNLIHRPHVLHSTSPPSVVLVATTAVVPSCGSWDPELYIWGAVATFMDPTASQLRTPTYSQSRPPSNIDPPLLSQPCLAVVVSGATPGRHGASPFYYRARCRSLSYFLHGFRCSRFPADGMSTRFFGAPPSATCTGGVLSTHVPKDVST